MAKRELIDKKKLIGKMKQSNAFDISERMKFSNLIEQQSFITEQEIVKPYLEKLKEQIAKFADKQLKIAMGTADLNERYAHIRVESAFRQCIAMIDNLLSEQEISNEID